VVDRQLDEITLKVALEDVEEPKTQPSATPSKRISTESPVRRARGGKPQLMKTHW
jgi:hypothetical protein